MCKNPVLCNLHIKAYFDQQKKDSNGYIINNLWFRVTCIILHNLQSTNLQDFAWKLNSLQFSDKRMLESTQQIRKIDLDYDVINHQWFRVVYIIFCNLQNTNSQILPTKTPPGNYLTDYWPKKKKEKKKKRIRKKKNQKIFASIYQEFLLDFFQFLNLKNTNWPRPNWLGLTWNLKLSIFQINSAFHQQNGKKS